MNKLLIAIMALALFERVISETVYFQERFEDGEDYKQRWVESTFKGAEQGPFKLSHGKFYGDAEKDVGIQTSQDARFYGISAKFEPFSNEGKSLVVQFTVKHEQKIDCGGGYVKLYPKDLDQKSLHGDSQYYIMFGPDICGYSTKKVYVIFNYKGKNLLTKKEIKCKDDELSHLYTLVVNPDNTYVVKIDNEKVESGKLEEDWDFLPPKRIPDPSAKKPEDWEDNEKIDDPNDTKPEDWDKPEFIPDPDAKKPDDWDEEMDGQWAPPKINNPEYKGEWKPRQIDNPKYKGPWVHPEIDNPEYQPDEYLYRYTDVGFVGFDLWQIKSGTIFDNILVTDDEKFAEQVGNETWGQTKDAEKKAKDQLDEEEKKREEEKRKEEEAQKESEKKDDEDDKEEESGFYRNNSSVTRESRTYEKLNDIENQNKQTNEKQSDFSTKIDNFNSTINQLSVSLNKLSKRIDDFNNRLSTNNYKMLYMFIDLQKLFNTGFKPNPEIASNINNIFIKHDFGSGMNINELNKYIDRLWKH